MNTPLLPAPEPEFQPAGPLDDGSSAGIFRLRLRRFLLFLPKFWWIPALTLVIGLALEAAYVHWKQPTFVSHSSMWETLKMELPEGDYFSEEMQDYLGTLTGLLQSETLRQQALGILRISTNSASIVLGKDGEPLRMDISVSGNPKSSVYLIKSSGSNPRFTQTYLDALMQAYLDYKRNVRREVSGETLSSISDQVQRWERDLNTQQDALLAFERTNNLAILQEEATAAGGYLTRLKTQLSDLQLEARLLDATIADQNTATNAMLSVPSMPLTSDVTPQAPQAGASTQQQSSFNDLQVLKLQRDRLSKYLKPKHPKIVALDEQIARGEKMQEMYRGQNREQLLAARQANQLKTDEVNGTIKEWETKVIQANDTIADAEHLKMNIQRTQSVYDRLTLLVQNVGISRNIDQETLAVLEPASPATRSYASEKSGLTMAIVGGLAAGLGLVFFIAVRDDRFTNITEVNATVGDAVVGLLPEVTDDGKTVMPLLALNDPRHSYAESYRSLRSALLFLPTGGERPKLLLISSAMPGEGKSTVAANLARTLAQSGSRVLLVDADLRKGHLHHLLGLQREPGLVELLNQTCTPAQVMQKDSLPNLTFIACGAEPSGNPGDLLLGSGLDKILAQWRQEFDYVVVDSSPLFAADDASCLAPKMDGTLFVVRNRHSGARATREAVDLLAQRQARILGVIYNGATGSGRSGYYYRYADYYPAEKNQKSGKQKAESTVKEEMSKAENRNDG
ncbi:MAG: polysaccharide biosynthesis tyrosine autokinase [Verrucomicrobiota bacterium]